MSVGGNDGSFIRCNKLLYWWLNFQFVCFCFEEGREGGREGGKK